jgi:DNA-binding transcriptional regulator YiaG
MHTQPMNSQRRSDREIAHAQRWEELERERARQRAELKTQEQARGARLCEITERIEAARLALGLTKSAFCRAFGMKPQTYNNFTGVQGSKPNAALLLGVVTAYDVDARWLLTGEGLAWPGGVLLPAWPSPEPAFPL